MDVILNRLDVDHVAFNITSTGSNVASVTLNDLLLDSGKNYVMRVTELNCPMAALPIFGFGGGTNVLDSELFRIKHRFPGRTENDFNVNPVFQTFGDPLKSQMRTKGPGNQIFYTTANFISTLAMMANTFTKRMNIAGIQNPFTNTVIIAANTDQELLKIKLNADGCVEFIGTPMFWDNFVIMFTPLGKTLFGVQDYVTTARIMSVNTRQDNTISYDMIEAGSIINLITNPTYKPAVNTTKIIGNYPLFRNLDHRFFVSVESDLMVINNIKVVDGVESTERGICKVYFPTECQVLLQSEDGILSEDVDFQLPTRIGQYSFIKKTAPSKQWVSLQTSYDLRFYRFHLYVTYRKYSETEDKFYFVQLKYPVAKTDNWAMAIEFVSKT